MNIIYSLCSTKFNKGNLNSIFNWWRLCFKKNMTYFKYSVKQN